jgi:hypothetical protein
MDWLRCLHRTKPRRTRAMPKKAGKQFSLPHESTEQPIFRNTLRLFELTGRYDSLAMQKDRTVT